MKTLESTLPAENLPPAEKQPPATMPRLHFIDGLRGMVMLMVLLGHCRTFGYVFHRLFKRPFMNVSRAAGPTPLS